MLTNLKIILTLLKLLCIAAKLFQIFSNMAVLGKHYKSTGNSKGIACNAGDLGSIPELGRFRRGGNVNPIQYSCLENPMDRETWWATVHGVAKSRT